MYNRKITRQLAINAKYERRTIALRDGNANRIGNVFVNGTFQSAPERYDEVRTLFVLRTCIGYNNVLRDLKGRKAVMAAVLHFKALVAAAKKAA